jgi:hypothetical protein
MLRYAAALILITVALTACTALPVTAPAAQPTLPPKPILQFYEFYSPF